MDRNHVILHALWTFVFQLMTVSTVSVHPTYILFKRLQAPCPSHTCHTPPDTGLLHMLSHSFVLSFPVELLHIKIHFLMEAFSDFSETKITLMKLYISPSYHLEQLQFDIYLSVCLYLAPWDLQGLQCWVIVFFVHSWIQLANMPGKHIFWTWKYL